MTDLRDLIVEAVEQDASTQYYAMSSVEVEGIADAVLAVLADHDAGVRAEALRDAADDLDSNFQDLPWWDRAYRNGARTRDWEHGALAIGGDVIRKLRASADRIERGEQE